MGILITIDGLDGSGKQTQSEILFERLKREGIDTTLVSFPDYDSSSSALVKMYLGGEFSHDPDAVNAYASSSFFAVDRFASFVKNWKSAYDRGSVIIANRYTTANAIHQLTKIEGDTQRKSFLEWLYDFEFNKLAIPSPDLTLFLEVPVEISLGLINKRSEETGREIDIHENEGHLKRAYSAALFSAETLGWTTVHCAENGKMRTREDIAEEIYKAVKNAI
ncbi:MAG: deoxynucleoside kinase [Clostridia bacterium]|nr:deoxynucleoside kinase [Clostridia bacterium]MBQ7897767.1 deoxynucleoside kinase [Clostridia bacterium]